MNGPDLIKNVKALNLPLGQYIVVGGGILSVLGLRDSKDIDITVSGKVFESLKEQEWEETDGPEGRKKLVSKTVEVFQDFKCGDYRPETADLIANAQIIDGVPFLKLEELLKFKKILRREKDLKDISLIESYIAHKT